jgi:hypothetical protein
MTRSDMDRTRLVRGWLGEGSAELSPRVLDSVLDGISSMSQDRPHWSTPRLQMTSFAAGAVVAAVTTVVVLAGASLVGGFLPGGLGSTPAPTSVAPTPTPQPTELSYRDVGFIGLPPPGATPSDPRTTELIESFFLPTGTTDFYYLGAAFLYDDGRLIWNEYYDSATSSTGWLEQRLTELGVRLARYQAAPRRMDSRGNETPRFLDPRALPRLLPERAWVDPTVRPYVPSGFAACLVVMRPPEDSSFSLAEKLEMLPMPIRVMLQDRAQLPSGDDVYGEGFDCLGMSTADARRLDTALREGGFRQDAAQNRWLLEYHIVLEGLGTLGIWFEPILPDGTITCSGCG